MSLTIRPAMYDIFTLPNELLNHIATYLDLVSKLNFGWTCGLFRSIIRHPVLWSDIWWTSNGKYDNLNNMKLALELHKMHVTKLSLTFNSKEEDPILFSILPLIQVCQHLQSLTLTNFTIPDEYLFPLLEDLPALSEFHLHSSSLAMVPIVSVRGRSSLKVVSIYDNRSFRTWAQSCYFPADVRVILPDMLSLKEHSEARYLEEHVMKKYHKPKHNRQCRNEASLTFCTPLLKYVSIPYVPIAQIYFTPPNMVPTVYRFPTDGDFYKLVMIEDGVGSNVIYGAASFPYKLFKEATLIVPSPDLTSVTLYNDPNLTEDDLQVIADLYPNLIHLDISFSDQCLENPIGLKTVAASCTKLESLNMDTNDDGKPIDHDTLWRTIRTMKNLKVLKISIHLIPSTLGANCLPSLKGLYLLYREGVNQFKFDDDYFKFFNNLPSLKYFRFESIPPVTVNIGLYNCLNTFTNLTHLYIHKYSGHKLTLPLVATCYRKLENLHLHCENFILSEALATTISRCKKLKILALKVQSLSVAAIRTMLYGLPLLVIFLVHTTDCPALGNRKAVDFLEQYLLAEIEAQGRMIDLEIEGQSTVGLFSQTQEHLFNQ